MAYYMDTIQAIFTIPHAAKAPPPGDLEPLLPWVVGPEGQK